MNTPSGSTDPRKHPVPLVVEWADAWAGEPYWLDRFDVKDTGEYLVRSVGWHLVSGKGGQSGHVTLAQSLGQDDAVDHIINIPIGMIRRVTDMAGRKVNIETLVRKSSR